MNPVEKISEALQKRFPEFEIERLQIGSGPAIIYALHTQKAVVFTPPKCTRVEQVAISPHGVFSVYLEITRPIAFAREIGIGR